MASHLTVISGTGGANASAKTFAGQQGAGEAASVPSGLLGLFAALLNNATANQQATAPAATDASGTTANSGAELDLAALFRLSLEANAGDQQDQHADPEAVAAAVAVPNPIVAAVQPKPMVDFVEALGALKTSLDKGEPLDPDLLDKVNSALTDLADALGLDIEKLSVPQDFAALLDTTDADQTGLAGALTQLLAPLAQSVATAQPATDAATIAQASDAASQLKALGDKLAALLGALEDGQVPADKLAALGMTPGQPLDAEIEAALNRFAAGASLETAKVPDQPALATPALKLTEPVLAGNNAATVQAADQANTSAQIAPADDTDNAASDDSNPSDDSGTDGSTRLERGRDRHEPAPREARNHPAPVAPAATDASNAPSPSADASSQQQTSMRIDAAANPRIIQTGYQTSQQQLNLPQIAFEMARQVQDGNSRFQIRLDPPELGRIDVHLDIDKTGQVNARLTVEKSETLDLMQRDQRGLERALQQAGLDGAKTNLEFSLKQNPFAGMQGQMGNGKDQSGDQTGSSANDNGLGAAAVEEAPPMVNLYRGALQASGVNIIA